MMVEKSSQAKASIRWMKVSQLFLAVIPPIIFGIFPIVFTMQQDASARAMREQDQRQADEINRRILFKEYIDDIKEILLNRNIDENLEKSLLYIRIQTLTVLRQLDPSRKRDLILFLYESRLLRHDQYPRIDLSGADLNGLALTKSFAHACHLPSLYLPGIYAENLILEGCYLESAIFDNASMGAARFDSCNLAYVKLSNTNLTRAQLWNNNMYSANLTGASLVQSSIRYGVFQSIDLTNADLYNSDIADSLINPLEYGGITANIVVNTRYPNGSFSIINEQDLIIDGQADLIVRQRNLAFVFNHLNSFFVSSVISMVHLFGLIYSIELLFRSAMLAKVH